ncbi:hypothetical protein GCM10007161_07350 [Ignatzschineria indica]|nr:hypothetical protein GCM10007161_07350 [Ignatzschineria indica]
MTPQCHEHEVNIEQIYSQDFFIRFNEMLAKISNNPYRFNRLDKFKNFNENNKLNKDYC